MFAGTPAPVTAEPITIVLVTVATVRLVVPVEVPVPVAAVGMAAVTAKLLPLTTHGGDGKVVWKTWNQAVLTGTPVSGGCHVGVAGGVHAPTG